MATQLHAGKAFVFPVAAFNADNTTNTSATITASSGNETKLIAKINPSNPREAGIKGVASTGGGQVNASISAPVGPGGASRSASAGFEVLPPEVDNSRVEFGPFGSEVDPPAWL